MKGMKNVLIAPGSFRFKIKANQKIFNFTILLLDFPIDYITVPVREVFRTITTRIFVSPCIRKKEFASIHRQIYVILKNSIVSKRSSFLWFSKHFIFHCTQLYVAGCSKN